MSVNKNTIIFSTIVLVTAMLIAVGLLFAKSDEEKINWLAEAYDVSEQGDIAFVKYNEGKPELYIKSADKIQLVAQLLDTKEITDLAFSPKGKELFYVEIEREKGKLHSKVNSVHIQSLETKHIFEDESIITEIEFDPKNEEKIYYLKAKTFENYSPIARAYPHEYDIYHFNLQTKEHVQHTDLNKYSMTSLQVSDVEDVVYVQMDDDLTADTPEDIFETKQRIFSIALAEEAGITVLTDPKRRVDVYDFALVPGEKAIVFQSISNYDAGGTFEYDLYFYNWEKNEEERLTDLTSYASRPIISKKENKIYFLVDDNFGKSNEPNRTIYSMDLNGENITEVDIAID